MGMECVRERRGKKSKKGKQEDRKDGEWKVPYIICIINQLIRLKEWLFTACYSLSAGKVSLEIKEEHCDETKKFWRQSFFKWKYENDDEERMWMDRTN